MKKDKIGFDDIFDLKDIEKTFTQTLEYDILKLMTKWEKEKQQENKKNQFKQEQDEYIKSLVRQVIKEELGFMLTSKGLFGEKFFRHLEEAGFERNCLGCLYAEKNYGYANMRNDY